MVWIAVIDNNCIINARAVSSQYTNFLMNLQLISARGSPEIDILGVTIRTKTVHKLSGRIDNGSCRESDHFVMFIMFP